jgi:arsenite methyltransferase
MTAPAKSFAGCCADLYELPIVEYLLGQSFHPGGTRLTRQLAGAALISPDAEVLDVACGIGNTTRLIAAEFGANVIGCDISSGNLERAAGTDQQDGPAARTKYIRCDAAQLPFASGSFDVVICECSLCLFDDLDATLDEIRRVLKPGGRIGISDFFLEAPVPEALDNLLGQVLCVASAQSKEAYRRAIVGSGFEFVRIRNVDWTLTDMIDRVRSRLACLMKATNNPHVLVPDSWGDPAPVLAALETFIADGGAGYLLATAGKLR